MKKISTTTTTNNFGGKKKLANYFIRLCGCFYLKKIQINKYWKTCSKKNPAKLSLYFYSESYFDLINFKIASTET